MSSLRRYLTPAELTTYTGTTYADDATTNGKIELAEQMIDDYVGFQQKAYQEILNGRVASVSGNTFTLQTEHRSVYQEGFFKNCVVEIIGGAGVGQVKTITASTYAGVLTHDAFSPVLDSTSIYRIYQLGKFPRLIDRYFDSYNTPNTWYKTVPVAVKNAVAAQVQFMDAMGAAYFNSDKSNLLEERIDNYSYRKSEIGIANSNPQIADKAKSYLKGILNRKGRFALDI